MFSDLEGKVRFDKETNASYIDMELDNHYFQQQKINNERFLDSWEVIGDHLHEQIECFRPTTIKSKKKPAFGEPDSVHITTDAEYVICIGENLEATAAATIAAEGETGREAGSAGVTAPTRRRRIYMKAYLMPWEN
jgi:hypothetical protein